MNNFEFTQVVKHTYLIITYNLLGKSLLLFFGSYDYLRTTAKGQLISECLFDVLNFPKNQRQISALESKKWSNHKIKAHYNDFDTNYVEIILHQLLLHYFWFLEKVVLGKIGVNRVSKYNMKRNA